MNREMLNVKTRSAGETQRLGGRLAQALGPGDIVCLHGDLGAGKTTLVKGMAQGLKISARSVNSPTFVLLNIYEGKRQLFHFDFYRLEDPAQIAAIGYEEFFYGAGIAVIEWPGRLGELMPAQRLDVEITHAGGDQRQIRFSPVGERYKKITELLKSAVRLLRGAKGSPR